LSFEKNNQENKLPFSVSICSKQTEVFCFHFHLQQTNGSCRFPFAEFWTQRHGKKDTWKRGEWRHGRRGNMDVETRTRRHGFNEKYWGIMTFYEKIKRKAEAQAISHNSFTTSSSRKTAVCH
jgi:hypothetical protein